MMGCLTVIAIFAVLIMLGSLLGRCSGVRSSTSDTPSTPSGNVLTGEDGVLDHNQIRVFSLAASESDYNRMLHSAAVNDTVSDANVFIVPRFTKVRVIGGNLFSKHVRILSVPNPQFAGNVNRAGWCPSEWVRPER